jgi:hypothetical protein
MAKATYSQDSVDSQMKNLIQIENCIITDDGFITFDVYFNVPDGLFASLWRYATVAWIPYLTAGPVENGVKYNIPAFNPFARYPKVDFYPGSLANNLPEYILIVKKGDPAYHPEYFGIYPILPEVDIKSYFNNKIAPSLEKCWEYFDDNDIWATVSGSEELTEEVDLKNGYFAQGFVWKINAIAEGMNPFANVHYWHKILRGDFRFIDPDKFTAKYPFSVHPDGDYGTNDAPPIGTSDFGWYTDENGDCWTVYVNNTSGADIPWANTPTLQVIVVYKKA